MPGLSFLSRKSSGGCSRELPAFASTENSSSRQLPQHLITIPHLTQKGVPLLRLERQCGLEHLLHEISSVLTQPEMEKQRSQLVRVPPLRGGDFQTVAHCEAAGMIPHVPVMRTVNNQGV